jgi:putative DNA primase/helicase
MTNIEKITLFKQTFQGRTEAYGAEPGQCVKEPLNDAVIEAHLTGQKRIGVYPLAPDIMSGSGTWWVAADIDDDDINLAVLFWELLEHIAIPCYIERSKSKGYHIWTFFSEPIEARRARGLMKYAIEGIERDTGFTIKELFPKQDTIKNQDGSFGFGNYIYLPLFGASVKNGRTVFLNPDDGFKPYPDQWSFLKNIEKVTPEMLKELWEQGEIGDGSPQVLVPKPAENSQKAAVAVSDRPTERSASRKFRDEGGLQQKKESFGTLYMRPCVEKMMLGVPEGCRNDVAFALAKHFRVEASLPQDITETILKAWNLRNTPPMSDKEILTAVDSAYTGKAGKGYTSFGCENPLIQPFCALEQCDLYRQKEKRVERPYFRGDAFIPKILADELMEETPFIYSGELLYRYWKGVYRDDGELFVRRRCREKLGYDARVNRINEVIAHIEDMTFLEPSLLNTEAHLINLQNGMYDWIEGRVLPHHPDYLSTVRIPVEYNPQATCPTVDKFFETTLPKDCQELAEELFGYALIPNVIFEKAFMLTGSGANGKSTFLTLLEKFVGTDNVSKIPLQELDENRFKRAEMFGKMVNLFADLSPRAVQDSAYFKTIVSGDMIDAERKYKKPFFFRPFARLVFSANRLPQSFDTSFAYYRRWCIIPFPNQFVGASANKSLASELSRPNELSGLLNRALLGLTRLFDKKVFSESTTVQEALEEYKRQNDTVAAFVSESCEFDPNSKIERGALYTAYTKYCASAGFPAVSNIACYAQVRAYPQVGEEKTPKARYFTGIKITSGSP